MTFLAENQDPNDHINPWLLTVLRHSNNTRIIVAKQFGPEIKNPLDIIPWISSTIRFWFTDGTAMTDRGIRQTSDGAIDSRDNLLGSPVASQNASGVNMVLCSPQVGGPESRQSTNFKRKRGESSNGSAASLKSELAAKRSPWKRQTVFGFGGSSSSESLSSSCHEMEVRFATRS